MSLTAKTTALADPLLTVHAAGRIRVIGNHNEFDKLFRQAAEKLKPAPDGIEKTAALSEALAS